MPVFDSLSVYRKVYPEEWLKNLPQDKKDIRIKMPKNIIEKL